MPSPAYRPSPAAAHALRALLRPDWPVAAGARAVLLEGPPGAGKSAWAEHASQLAGARLVVYQAHAWTDADELFVGVDVQAAVAGDAAAVRQDGVLAVVAKASHEATASGIAVVLLLDEVDKTSERAEALLLDWLQSGRVPVRPGQHLATRLERVLVVLTSNGQRPLGDALLRRVRRLALAPLPVTEQEALLAERSGLPPALVRVAWKAARAAAKAEGNEALSLQEGLHLLAELALAESPAEVKLSLEGWAARTAEGRAACTAGLVGPVWALLQESRR